MALEAEPPAVATPATVYVMTDSSPQGGMHWQMTNCETIGSAVLVGLWRLRRDLAVVCSCRAGDNAPPLAAAANLARER
eukprot:10844817-Alexandrium_andersonii.AAC.1